MRLHGTKVFFYVCFNSHVSYEDHIAQGDEWMSVEYLWNTDMGKHRYLEKTLSHCHWVHKYHLSGLGLNWGLGGDRLAANNLKHGLAWAKVLGINSNVNIQAVSCEWLSPRTTGGGKQIEACLAQYKFWAKTILRMTAGMKVWKQSFLWLDKGVLNGGDLPPCRESASVPAGCIIRGFHYFIREKSFLRVHVIRWISGIFFMSLHVMVKIFSDKWMYFSPLLGDSIRTFILALCDFSNTCAVKLFLSQSNEVDESGRVFSACLGSP